MIVAHLEVVIQDKTFENLAIFLQTPIMMLVWVGVSNF